jgi:hypothetical protein
MRNYPQSLNPRVLANSNCPSREQGGDLGWLTSPACAPELARVNERSALPQFLAAVVDHRCDILACRIAAGED